MSVSREHDEVQRRATRCRAGTASPSCRARRPPGARTPSAIEPRTNRLAISPTNPTTSTAASRCAAVVGGPSRVARDGPDRRGPADRIRSSARRRRVEPATPCERRRRPWLRSVRHAADSMRRSKPRRRDCKPAATGPPRPAHAPDVPPRSREWYNPADGHAPPRTPPAPRRRARRDRLGRDRRAVRRRGPRRDRRGRERDVRGRRPSLRPGRRSTGLEPGSSTPYEVRLDGDVGLAGRRTPTFPPSRIRTIDPARPIRLLFGSCREAPALQRKGHAAVDPDVLDRLRRADDRPGPRTRGPTCSS